MDIHSNLTFPQQLQANFIDWKNSDSLVKQIGSHTVGPVAMLAAKIYECVKELVLFLYEIFGKIIHGSIIAIPNAVLWLGDCDLYKNRFSINLAFEHLGNGIHAGIDTPGTFFKNLWNPNWNFNQVEWNKLKDERESATTQINQLTLDMEKVKLNLDMANKRIQKLVNKRICDVSKPTIAETQKLEIKTSLSNIVDPLFVTKDSDQLSEELDDLKTELENANLIIQTQAQRLLLEKEIRSDLVSFFEQHGGHDNENYGFIIGLLRYLEMFIDKQEMEAAEDDLALMEAACSTPILGVKERQIVSDFLEFTQQRPKKATLSPIKFYGTPSSPLTIDESDESHSPLPTTPLYSTIRKKLEQEKQKDPAK